MKRSAFIAILIAGALAAFWYLWPNQRPAGAPAAPAGGDASSAATSVQAAGSSGGTAADGSKIVAIDGVNAPGSLQGTAPQPGVATVSRARSGAGGRTLLAELQSMSSALDALREAAASGDPAALAFIGEIVAFCTLYTSREGQSHLADDRFLPVRLRSSRTPFKTPVFPAPEDEARFRDNQRAIRQFCAGFDAKAAAAAEAAAIEKLNAQGSPYQALGVLFRGNVNFTGLNQAQYDAIEKALAGGDIGTLALLGFQAQPLLNNYVHAANAQLDGARVFGQNTGLIAWQLALCQLGAPCGGDSLWARDACFRYGACGADFAAGIRHALVRDGIAADALDRIARDWAAAMQAKDPTRINFRKAP